MMHTVYNESDFDPMIITGSTGVSPTIQFDPLDIIGRSGGQQAVDAAAQTWEAIQANRKKLLIAAGLALVAYLYWRDRKAKKAATPALAGARRRRRSRR